MTVLDTDAALEALGPEWDTLWRANPSATPFQSPRWLLPWWRQFGTGMPRVAVERKDGRLVGVLPLYVLPDERKALPIGAGTTDYLDALGEPTTLLSAALRRIADDAVDVCDLIEIPPLSRLARATAPGWGADNGDGSPCPVLALPDLPAGIRRKLRMNRHRADRIGGWRVDTADAATLPSFLDDLIRLHQARWTVQGETGALASAPVLAFWREAAPLLLQGGLLRLQRVRVGDAVAAVIATLLAPGRIFFYLGGFDEAHAFVSPGTLLIGAMLEQASAEGRTEAHFLRGQERYKYAWGALDRVNRTVRLTRA